MPLYELNCRDCDHNWDVKLEWKAPLPACPECGSESVRKVYHPAALIFRGSGWHVTDYGKNGSKAGSSSNGKSSSNGAAKESSTTSESVGSSGSSGSSSSSTSASSSNSSD